MIKNKVSAEEFLAKEASNYRRAGCELAEAAAFVIRESDGIHRLSLAVAEWYKSIAGEGGRPHL